MATMVDRQRRITVSDQVVCAELEGESVLLNIESGVYFGLDSVGTAIWQLLERGTTEQAIVEQLEQEYDAQPDELRNDVAVFLGDLRAQGLIGDRAE